MLPLHPPAHDTTPQLGVVLERAATLIASADALIIGAGAGMSADSGISVYRGSDGRYTDPQALIDANATTFDTDPLAAAETTRRRYADLLTADPHAGYAILDRWRRTKAYGAFVFTSNVDDMFTRAGFPANALYEVHGSHARSQCLTGCGGRTPDVFDTPSPDTSVAVCPACGEVARPNTLMFGDYGFSDTYREQQWDAFGDWFDTLPTGVNLAILEVGAGNDVRTVRNKCEALAAAYEWPLIRVNPSEPDLPSILSETGVAVPVSGLDALRALDSLITPKVG